MFRRLVRWLGCIVLISLAPVLLKCLDLLWDKKDITRPVLLGDGELFIIACAIAGAGIFETYGLVKLKNVTLTAGIGCFLCSLVTAYAYGRFRYHDHDPLVAANWSMAFFAVTLLAATICVLLGPQAKRR